MNIVDDPCVTEKVYPYLDRFKPIAADADKLGLVRPPLLKSPQIRYFSETRLTGTMADNSFTELTNVASQAYVASGRAINPQTAEPPAAVLLAYDRGQGDEVVFAIAFPQTATPMLDTLLRRSSESGANWRKPFTLRDLPAGVIRITAWGFDAETGKAYRLSGDYAVQNADSHEMR